MKRLFVSDAAQQLLLLLLLSSTVTRGFVPTSDHPGQRARITGTLSLAALTERQMQFWEDVDSGLDDIENFYAKKGQDINRIRTFAKT